MIHTLSLSLAHTYFDIDTVYRRRKRETVRFMSSAQYLGLHLGWLFRKAFRVFFSAFIFAAFKATSLLFCAGFFSFQFKSLHSIGVTAIPGGSSLRRA